MDDELRAIAIRMADQVRELLPARTVASYQRFLDAMVHYTRGHGARLAAAVTHAASDDHRAYFAALARDDGHHDRLAAADLAGFGLAPSTDAPAIAAFDRAWRAWRDQGRVGALHVLASATAHLAGDARRHLGSLGPTRFVDAHFAAAAPHGGMGIVDRAAAVAAARVAADFWVGLHFDVFT